MKIEVRDNKDREDVTIVLKDASFCVDTIGKPSILFWLNEDEADKLSFQLSSVLQDRERRKTK
jgi:hypothetical protein